MRLTVIVDPQCSLVCAGLGTKVSGDVDDLRIRICPTPFRTLLIILNPFYYLLQEEGTTVHIIKYICTVLDLQHVKREFATLSYFPVLSGAHGVAVKVGLHATEFPTWTGAPGR